MNGVRLHFATYKTAVSLVFVRFHTLKLAGSDETKSCHLDYFVGTRKRSRMRR